MRNMILLLIVCFGQQLMGMELDRPKRQPGQILPVSIHDQMHAEDLSFIASSNKPLTTATAVGNCKKCLKHAIFLHSYHSLYPDWILNCCRRKSKLDEDVRQAVWNATAHRENIAQLRLLLKEFEGAKKVMKAGRPLLFHAVAHMNLEAAAMLLECGAQVDEQASGETVYADHTPLMLAVHVHSDKRNVVRCEIVHDLLCYGAQINAQRINTKETPLLLARDSEIASLLIDHGAYVDDSDKDRRTIFDADYMRPLDGSYAHLGGLVKKILIEGALRSNVLDTSEECQCPECNLEAKIRRDRARLEREYLLQQVQKKLHGARIPQVVQVLIFSYLPISRHMCSVSQLVLFGDLIKVGHSHFAAEYVSQKVLNTVVKRLSAQKKSIFATRMAEALAWHRILALDQIAGKEFRTKSKVAELIGECVPEYRLGCGQGGSIWPPDQLVVDIKEYYRKKLWE